MKKPRLVYYHDSRHQLLYRLDPPMSVHQLRRPVDELLGTPVDTLSYGLGMGQTFLYDTKVGTRFGEKATEHNHGLVWWRAAENLKQALARGLDPLQIVVDRAHEKGMQVLGSLRINDGGAPEGSNYNVGRLKYERPDVMIGEDDPERPHVATCLDFAIPEVREERLAVIEEVCDRYGADGIEIDQYVRVFFKPSEVRQNTPILTEWVRDVRKLLDGIGKRRGERLCVAARVDPSEEANLSVGMDVGAWLSEKLVDMVIPHPSGIILDTTPSFGWLAEVAHQAGGWIYPPIGQVFPYDDRHHELSVEMYRAATTNYRVAGADGLYMSDLGWPRTEREYMILREMGDPDIHARKSKHYAVAQIEAKPDPYGSKRYLPATLEEGVAARVPVFIGDALESARADGELERVILGVRIVQACPGDRFSVRLNGSELPLDRAKTSTYYGGTVAYFPVKSGMPNRIDTHYWYELDVPLDLLREGENEVEVTMERHFRALLADRVLQSVEVHVDYKEPPIPVQGQM